MFSTANYSETERRHQQVKTVITTEHKDSPCKSLNEASVVLCLTARTMNPGRIEGRNVRLLINQECSLLPRILMKE